MEKAEAIKQSTKYYADLNGNTIPDDNDILAANIFVNKYALTDKDGSYIESTPDDMHRRIAKEFTRIELQYNKELDYNTVYTNIFSLLEGFKYIVPQGSPMSGIGNTLYSQSLSNCVVLSSPIDSISGIFDRAKDSANIFKRRGGVGIDLSSLRPEGCAVNNSAKTSTGAWSFANMFSTCGRIIGQNGRRAAFILSLKVNHPDIIKFVTCKTDKTSVTGANISVLITDEFMEAVKNNKTFTLKWPTDSENPQFTKEVNAKELWDLITTTATKTAEPGLLFIDNIKKYLPADSYPRFRTITTNPCGELPLSGEDTCRLISINLKNLLKSDSKQWIDSVESLDNKITNIDFVKLENIARTTTRLADNLVTLEIEKLDVIINNPSVDNDEKILWKKIKSNTEAGRRVGIGTHGLADLFARLGIEYGSNESIEVAKLIYATIRNAVYDESINLAIERSPFPEFQYDIEKDNLFIQSLPQSLQERIKQHGRRNISLLTLPPTGSVSILSQTSSGIEPVFQNNYIRYVKINTNNTDQKVDRVNADGEKFYSTTIWHKNIRQYLDCHNIVESELPSYFVTANNINWINRINIQAEIQKYIDHSISSTINLPKDTSSATVANIYTEAYNKGLKGITVYVDGSREGILVDNNSKPNNRNPNIVERPAEVNCDIHKITVKGNKYCVIIGIVDNKPYEVFAGSMDKVVIPNNIKHGIMVKNIEKGSKNTYDLKVDEDGMYKDIVKLFDNTSYANVTRLISLSLRCNIPIHLIYEQLSKCEQNESFDSFWKAVSRILKKYIQNNTEVTNSNCPDCQNKLIYEEGCVKCQSCGWTACS